MLDLRSTLCVLGLLTLATLNSGCSTAPIEVEALEIERAKLNLPKPSPLTLDPVEWLVITEENAPEVFAELRKRGEDPVLFGVTDEGYETLSLNLANVRRFIILQDDLIDRYKDYYEGADVSRNRRY